MWIWARFRVSTWIHSDSSFPCSDETTSHSTRLSKDDSQVAGYAWEWIHQRWQHEQHNAPSLATMKSYYPGTRRSVKNLVPTRSVGTIAKMSKYGERSANNCPKLSVG